MSKRQSGVDGAIALLLAVTRHNGEASTATLAAETGLARASLHRIASTLAASGLLQPHHGRIGIGATGATFAMEREARPPMRPAIRLPSTRSETVTGPLALSAPAIRRRNGRYRIGFSNASMSNPWRVALVHSVEFAASRLGPTIDRLTIRHAGDDALQQVADIEALIGDGVDGLIVSAVVPDIVAPVVERAMTLGIAVVLVDRGVAAEVPHTSFVSTDDGAIGHLTALWLAERLEGRGTILMLPGHAEAEPARQRLAAAHAVFAGFPDLDILPAQWTGWLRQSAQDIVSHHLSSASAPIAGVWCDSGLQGVGSLQAFIGANSGRAIPPHTGGDLNLAYKLAIRHGVPLAAVDYPPAMGLRAVDVLHASLRGQWVPSRVDVRSEVVLTKGSATRSVKADRWAEDHVRWDLPDDLILHSGLGEAYDPRSFRIHYAGNSYNRSAARVAP